MTDPTTRDVPDQERYELVLDGEVVGFADYRRQGDVLVLPHTVIDPRRRGQGLGAVLVGHLLEDVRRRGLQVVPQCWYVAAYLRDHPELADLVAGPTNDQAPDAG